MNSIVSLKRVDCRRNRGFTIIELLVVVVIMGILAATGLANFMEATTKSKVAQTKANMHSIQLAAEEYGVDTAGWYPMVANDLGPYMPGGSNSPGGAPGNWPVNPFNSAGASPPPDDASSITNIAASRLQAAGSLHDYAGAIVYDHGLAPHSYAIWGCDDTGHSVPGNMGMQLVLSNQ